MREPALRDCEDSIEDTRERGGESPLVEDGAETDFDQGVKRGLMNFEEKDFFDVGRDWRDVEEVDGLRLTTAGRGGGGIWPGVHGMESVDSRQRDSSYWPSSRMQSGSGTMGSGANLIFLDWARLDSSSEGRVEAWRAGELGRDLEKLRGGGTRRMDCRVEVAIGRGRRRRLTVGSEPKYRNIAFERISPDHSGYSPKGKLTKIMFEGWLGVFLSLPASTNGNSRTHRQSSAYSPRAALTRTTHLSKRVAHPRQLDILPPSSRPLPS